MRAFPTTYNGTLFRSKLEADYARWFDRLGLRWAYEQHAHYWGDVFYCPDFWLSASRQWFEVKGKAREADGVKWHALVNHSQARRFTDSRCADIPLVVGCGTGACVGFFRIGQLFPIDSIKAASLSLCQCRVCSGWWFCAGEAGTWLPGDGKPEQWRCQCCGAIDITGWQAHIGRTESLPVRALAERARPLQAWELALRDAREPAVSGYPPKVAP